jgi:anti-anti-sigma factor
MDALEVDIAERGRTAILTLAGALTGRHVAALRRAVFAAEGGLCGHLVLDMTEVDEIDGYGLAALVGMLSRQAAKQGKVVLFGVRPDLRTRFEATFCDTLFPLRNSLAAALELVEEQS